MVIQSRPPTWFWVATALLVAWGAIGVFAFYTDITMDAAARAALSDYDRRLLASRPAWFPWLYGAAVWSGLLGALALALRSRHARWLSIVSLVLVVVMFGYIFAVTDLIAVKGFGAAAGFPIVVALAGAFQLWLADRALRRGWLT